MNTKITATAIVFILTAIVLGAFGAHALKEVLSEERLQSFETGVRYQMYHGLALLIVGLSAERFSFSLNWFYRLILMGSLFFSVSIYLPAMQDVFGMSFSFLGPITPLGGSLLIAGWFVLLVKMIRQNKE